MKRVLSAMDAALITYMLSYLDCDKIRARLACVCKTWRSCVRISWDKVHFCFKTEEKLRTQITWLDRQLLDSPLLLQSLELHSSSICHYLQLNLFGVRPPLLYVYITA